MNPLATLISETAGCSVVPWPFDSSLRKLPEGCPADVAAFATEIYRFHLFETVVPEGVMTTAGSFDFNPTFDVTVADLTFLDPEQHTDPALIGFKRCFSLGCFGSGNDQLILDLSDPTDPKLRYFYYFPVDPLATYPIVKMTFDAFVRACINAGPNVCSSVIWWTTRCRPHLPCSCFFAALSDVQSFCLQPQRGCALQPNVARSCFLRRYVGSRLGFYLNPKAGCAIPRLPDIPF